MQVKLKVIGGKNDGREIKISIPEFIIGRGDEAHLKPSSDLISRNHCSIKIENNAVTIRDMGSRNGTFINGQQITGPHIAKVGDLLRVGRLQFEILIDVTQPSNKRPKVEGVAEAAVRTASVGNKGDDIDLDESISDWLRDDVGDKSVSDTTQLSLEDTRAILAEAERKARQKELEKKNRDDSGVIDRDDSSDSSPDLKKGTGKLPPLPKHSHETSKNAADDVLRKFFNRR